MGLLPVQRALRELSNPNIAEHSQRFFKTGPGEYGEGDRFLGVRVPEIRKLAKKYQASSMGEISHVLCSEYHEERLLALVMLVLQFEKADVAQRKVIYRSYLKNTQYINNWDLVDSSAHQIVGGYLQDKERSIMKKLAKSNVLWERRIAIISTYRFIKLAEFEDTLVIAEVLLNDQEDLIHKAVGWMLREVGKKNRQLEIEFLDKHYQSMPRVMLRYAIERLDDKTRQVYLNA